MLVLAIGACSVSALTSNSAPLVDFRERELRRQTNLMRRSVPSPEVRRIPRNSDAMGAVFD